MAGPSQEPIYLMRRFIEFARANTSLASFAASEQVAQEEVMHLFGDDIFQDLQPNRDGQAQPPPRDGEVREWGRARIMATYVGLHPRQRDAVELITARGGRMAMPWSRLRRDDREFLYDRLAYDQFFTLVHESKHMYRRWTRQRFTAEVRAILPGFVELRTQQRRTIFAPWASLNDRDRYYLRTRLSERRYNRLRRQRD